MTEPSITCVGRLEVRCVERGWPWAEENAAAIAAYWAQAQAVQPNLFDGPLFMFAEVTIADGCCRAVCFETSFARLLYAKRHGFPDPEVTNGFAMGALETGDGAFLLGVMGPQTANAGRIYFPAGTPDPQDLQPDGSLNLIGSLTRELAEETGIEGGAYEVGAGWILVRDGRLMACLRPLRFAAPADEVRAHMLARMRMLPEEELSDIRVVRTPQDIDPVRMPRYIQAFLRWSFAERAKP